MKLLKAVKKAYVSARESAGNEKIKTFAADGLETVNVTVCGDIVVTATDRMGTPVLRNGKENIWVVDPNVFNEKYILTEKAGVYRPKGDAQIFVVLDHDSEFTAPWGELQKIKKGGVINVTNFDDIYGIGETEFNNTYSVIETKEF